MKTHTNFQKIEYQGKPTFVLVPWEDFEHIRPWLERKEIHAAGIPQALVEAHLLKGISIIRAWREHLGLTQRELATKMGVSQAAVAKLENPLAKPRKATLAKVAVALGIALAKLDV
jgi:DNA-binding XRE family transcriptional regulator